MKSADVFAAIGVLLLPAMVYAIKIGSAYLRARIAAAEDEKTKNIIENALNIIEIAVATVEQTFVLPAKAGGEWTANTDGETAKKQAKEIIDKLITDEHKTAVGTLCRDVEAFVDAAIEKTCLGIKQRDK